MLGGSRMGKVCPCGPLWHQCELRLGLSKYHFAAWGKALSIRPANEQGVTGLVLIMVG